MGSGMCHGKAEKSDAIPVLAVSWSSACSHHVCAQQTAILKDQRSATVQVPVLSGLAHVNVQHFEHEPPSSAFAGLGPSLCKSSSPVDLHTIQRV
jgi:hypothetical protein